MQVKSLAKRQGAIPPSKRWKIAFRATHWVEDGGPNAERGTEALEDISHFEGEFYAERRITIGALSWEPHEGQWLMSGYDGEQELAGIDYMATHTASRKKALRLIVLGRRHADMFHQVDETRALAEEFYRRRTTTP